MSRLTERNEYQVALCIRNGCYDCLDKDSCIECDMNRAILNKLAHYEDLEEQGRLLILPCEVGEKAWYISSEKTVRWLIFDYEWLGYYKPEELFATKEEAELKLKELKGE